VRDAKGLDAERTDFDHIARLDRMQIGLDVEFLELVLDEAEGERHPVNRNLQLLDEKRNRADVVLVPCVRNTRANALRPLEEVRHVGNDHVDAERGRIGNIIPQSTTMISEPCS